MSLPSHQPPPPSEVEQQTVTDWRLIFATGVGLVFFISALVGISVLLPRSKAKSVTQGAPAQPKAAPIVKNTGSAPILVQAAATEECAAASAEAAELVSADPPTEEKPAPRAVQVLEELPAPGPLPEATVAATPKVQPATSPPPPIKEAAEPTYLYFKRINHTDEDKLAAELRQTAHEIDLDRVAGSAAKLLASANAKKVQTVLDLLPERPDLRGLPVRKAPACQLDKKAAQKLQVLSRGLRSVLFELNKRNNELGSQGAVAYFAHEILMRQLDKGEGSRTRLVDQDGDLEPKDWHFGDTVSPLVQVLQGEDKPVRSALVYLLSQIDDASASAALAQRALFDLSADVREEAVRALTSRPKDDYRPVLLDGLRYPWPPVADHAAEALVAVGDREAIPSLVDLLDKPDPATSVLGENGKGVVPELVQVNHLRNCLLCHSPSFNRRDLVRGPVPTPEKSLNESEPYYGRFKGPAIRADVTYLKQDFSALQPVKDHGKWPEMQRHDYLIRMRELTPEECKRLRSARTPQGEHATTYPQREAVLFALRELSGRDAGSSAKAWKMALAKDKPIPGKGGQ